MSIFTLHEQLEKDTAHVAETTEHLLLLVNDARYAWCIVVPKFVDIREIYELTQAQQQSLWSVSATLSRELMQLFKGDKFNVAALGNMVPQLHLHHIVRHKGDAAWPSPVWGQGDAVPYGSVALQQRLDLLRSNLSLCSSSPS